MSDDKDEVHPIPWVGEGTVPDLPAHEAHRARGLARFAAGTAAVALAVGVGGGLVIRDQLGQHEPQAAVTTSTSDQAQAPAPAPAPSPAPQGEAHEDD